MICYRDRSFCSSSEECRADCYRRLRDWQQRVADEMGLPVCYVEFRNTDECPGFEPITSNER